MFAIIDADAKDEALIAARKILYRERVHTVVLSPALPPLPHPYPLRGLLILRPEQLSDLAGTVARARATFPNLPLALFVPKGKAATHAFDYRRLADFVYEENASVARVTADLLDAYSARTQTDECHIVGGLHLSRAEEYATLYGLPILLTQVEWMLLYYLLQAHPRPVSASELSTVAFWPEREISPHNVSARLSGIRKKIRTDFPKATVIQRKEDGYCLFG